MLFLPPVVNRLNFVDKLFRRNITMVVIRKRNSPRFRRRPMHRRHWVWVFHRRRPAYRRATEEKRLKPVKISFFMLKRVRNYAPVLRHPIPIVFSFIVIRMIHRYERTDWGCVSSVVKNVKMPVSVGENVFCAPGKSHFGVFFRLFRHQCSNRRSSRCARQHWGRRSSVGIQWTFVDWVDLRRSEDSTRPLWWHCSIGDSTQQCATTD